MATVYRVIQQPLDQLLYRWTGGRATVSSLLSGIPISMLTTTGARTGRPHTVPVLALPDGADVILIASNFGRRRHPAWYHNLRAHPQARITTAGVRRDFVTTELEGVDRERNLERAEEIFPPFARYPRWAEYRQIPVLRLHPSDG